MLHRSKFPFLLLLLLFVTTFCAASEKFARVQAADPARSAAPAGVARPVLGFAFDDSASSLRAISGIPGAAMLGRPFAACGQGFQKAAVSTRANYLLGTAGDDPHVILCRNLEANALASALDQAPASPDRILISPNGSTAALFYAGTRMLLLVRGLPGAPAVSELGLSGLGEAASILAVSDAGSVLAAAPAGSGEVLALVNSEGVKAIAAIGRASAAAFLHGRDEAIVADSLQNTAYFATPAGLETLASERDGINAPAAVAVSADNREAVVANAGNSNIARLNLSGGVPNLIACNCKASGLEALQGNAVFRIVAAAGDPMLVYDGDAQVARVVIVPPEAGASRTGPEAGRNPGIGRGR